MSVWIYRNELIKCYGFVMGCYYEPYIDYAMIEP